MQLPSLLRALKLRPGSLVHLGAHWGQELEDYLSCGFERILLVEANPQAYAVLEQRVNGRPRVHALLRAVWDHSGPVRLHLTRHETQASLLPPGPDIETVGECEVQASLLEEILAEAGLSNPTVLVLDLQGAELRVLQSSPDVLRRVPLLITEVNDERRYEGCALAGEVDEFLTGLGFCMLGRSGPFPGCPGGDAVYLSTRWHPAL